MWFRVGCKSVQLCVDKSKRYDFIVVTHVCCIIVSLQCYDIKVKRVGAYEHLNSYTWTSTLTTLAVDSRTHLKLESRLLDTSNASFLNAQNRVHGIKSTPSCHRESGGRVEIQANNRAPRKNKIPYGETNLTKSIVYLPVVELL